jgi:hypothetical protein
MKRFLITLSVCVSGITAHAQQFGLSAQALAFFQVPRQYEYSYGTSERIIRTGGMPAAGFRLEGNYILPGYTAPVSAYNGIGITFLAPKEDSCVYYARLNNSGGLQIAGTRKTSLLSIGFRCGYEIPQEFNDFLMLHVGWGVSWIRYTNRYILPEESAQFAYSAGDFEGDTFDKTKSRAIGLELVAGGVYEFEHFSALAQYSFLFPTAASDENVVSMRHGISVGIFYPLYRL